MEQNNFTPETKNQSKQNTARKTFLIIMSCLIIALLVGIGIYVWQQDASNKKQQALQSQVDTLKAQTKTDIPKTDADNFTYSSKVGGLKLTLSKNYPLIVNVDGNKGGAPGSTFKVGKLTAEGVIEDNVYEWVQIDIGHSGSRTLDEAVNIVSNQLKETNFSNVTVVDAKVDSQAAKLLTADGMGYDAKRRVYVVKSGEFTYEIASKTQDTSKDGDMLKAVLAGINIEAKKLN